MEQTEASKYAERGEEFNVYLAGPVYHTNNGGNTWREAVKEEWSEQDRITFIDPVKNHEYDPEIHSAAQTVIDDKSLIAKSDGVIVGDTGERSPGTWREVEYAFSVEQIPIVVWDGPLPMDRLVEKNPFSPWAEADLERSAYFGSVIEMLVDRMESK